MKEQKPRKPFPALFVTAAMIALLIVALPYARGLLIRDFGIRLTPEGDIPVRDVPAFLQNDERWADDTLGQTQYRMAGHGCLVACLASVMAELGEDIDPGRLNRALDQAGAYTEDGEIIWSRLEALGFSHRYQNDFGESTLERLLSEELLPIVKVRYRQTGAYHWVVIVGAEQEDFLVLDPLEASLMPVSLQTHGKVYAYRALTRE